MDKQLFRQQACHNRGLAIDKVAPDLVLFSFG